jgi:hypothetical protein
MSTADAAPPALSAAASAAPRPSSSALNTSRYTDANSDHVVLFPTAETHPRGTFFFTDYEIFIPQFGYALTDHVELELTYLPPLIVDLAVKANLYRGDWLRFALVGAGDLSFGFAEFPPIYRLAGVGTLCLSRECWSSVSFTGMGLASRSDLFPHTFGAAFSAGGIIAVSRVVKLLLEPTVLWEPGDSAGTELAWAGGVRFSGEIWGLDLGVIPSGQEFGPYLPWLAFTLRTRGARPLE